MVVVKMIPVRGCVPFLPTMKFTRCLLHDLLDLSQTTQKELDYTRNSISSLDVSLLPRGLEVLILDQNLLRSDSFPPRLPDTLQTLSVRENSIRNLRELEEFPSGCKIIHLDMNPLETLQGLPDTVEVLTTDRTHLDRVERLPKQLQFWTSKSCDLQMLPSRLPTQLRVLHLSGNCLKYAGLPRFWGNALEELYLDRNELTRMPQNLPASLRILNVANNSIQQVQAPLPENLEVFCAVYNRIQDVGPVVPRKKPIVLVDVRCNLLTESLPEKNVAIRSKWATTILEDHNWSTPTHIANKSIIVKAWRRYRLRSRLHSSSNTWKQMRILKEELFIVSMCPDRCHQIDTLSPEWKY